MKNFDYITNPAKLLTPEIVQMVGSIHEHKGKQELFLEANIDELKTLLEVALIQSTGASNRIEGIFTSDKRLEELVSQKAEPRNRSEQEIAGYREVLATIHESYEYIMILSRLVDTFFSRISPTMQLPPKHHSIAYVLPWAEGLHWQSRSSGCSNS